MPPVDATRTQVQSGCWNRVELNELSVIMATAVDWEGDRWVTSYQVVTPQSIAAQAGSGSGGNQSPVSVFSTEGSTLSEAIQRISTELSRRPFFAHNRLLVISDKVAREKGLTEIIDFYLREAESRETVDVVLSKGSARKLIEILNPQEKIPANAIDRIFIETESQLSIIRRIKLLELAAILADPSRNAMFPEIRISGEMKNQDSLDSLKETKQSAVLKTGDIGVFKKDRLIGWLDRDESSGIAWLTNHIRRASIPFSCAENSPKQATFRVERSSTTLKPVVSGEQITMKAVIEPRGVLTETGCGLDVSKPDHIHKVEQMINDQIRSDIMTTWRNAKKMKADLFGFGDAIRKKNPRQWKKLKESWSDRLAEVELELEIRASVQRTGMIGKPFSDIMAK